MTWTEQVEAETTVRQLEQAEKPNLRLVTSPTEVNRILDRIGVNHDPDSIVREDSFNSLLIDTEHGDYTEVWAMHYGTPHLDHKAFRFI